MNIGKFFVLVILIAYVYMVVSGMDRFWINSGSSRAEAVEAAIRKAAVQCYALEGSYPPNIEYLQKNYGVALDKNRYYYFYNVFASNVMPEIGVYEKNSKEGVAVDVQ